MRALLRKELRELAPYAAVAFLLLLVYDLASGAGARRLLGASDDGLGVLLRSIALGGIAGYVALRSEVRRGTLESLLHRGSGLRGALIAKALAGSTLPFLASALPILLLALASQATWRRHVIGREDVLAQVALATAAAAACSLGLLTATWQSRGATRLAALALGGFGLFRFLLSVGAEAGSAILVPVISVVLAVALLLPSAHAIPLLNDPRRQESRRATVGRATAALLLVALPLAGILTRLCEALLLQANVPPSPEIAIDHESMLAIGPSRFAAAVHEPQPLERPTLWRPEGLWSLLITRRSRPAEDFECGFAALERPATAPVLSLSWSDVQLPASALVLLLASPAREAARWLGIATRQPDPPLERSLGCAVIALALLAIALAARRIRRRGGSWARVATWSGAIATLGVLAYAAIELVEPRVEPRGRADRRVARPGHRIERA